MEAGEDFTLVDVRGPQVGQNPKLNEALNRQMMGGPQA
jgi:hypothetical protein